MYYKYFLIYLGIISIISMVICCYDKIAAKYATRHRIREAPLFWLSIIGGSVAMLITMHTIRHKTRHKRFMIGIPVIIILQVALTVLVGYFLL